MLSNKSAALDTFGKMIFHFLRTGQL